MMQKLRYLGPDMVKLTLCLYCITNSERPDQGANNVKELRLSSEVGMNPQCLHLRIPIDSTRTGTLKRQQKMKRSGDLEMEERIQQEEHIQEEYIQEEEEQGQEPTGAITVDMT